MTKCVGSLATLRMTIGPYGGKVLCAKRVTRRVRPWEEAIATAAPTTYPGSKATGMGPVFAPTPDEKDGEDLTIAVAWFYEIAATSMLRISDAAGTPIAGAYDILSLVGQYPDLPKEIGMVEGVGVLSRPSPHPDSHGLVFCLWCPRKDGGEPAGWRATLRWFDKKWENLTLIPFLVA